MFWLLIIKPVYCSLSNLVCLGWPHLESGLITPGSVGLFRPGPRLSSGPLLIRSLLWKKRKKRRKEKKTTTQFSSGLGPCFPPVLGPECQGRGREVKTYREKHTVGYGPLDLLTIRKNIEFRQPYPLNLRDVNPASLRPKSPVVWDIRIRGQLCGNLCFSFTLWEIMHLHKFNTFSQCNRTSPRWLCWSLPGSCFLYLWRMKCFLAKFLRGPVSRLSMSVCVWGGVYVLAHTAEL